MVYLPKVRIHSVSASALEQRVLRLVEVHGRYGAVVVSH